MKRVKISYIVAYLFWNLYISICLENMKTGKFAYFSEKQNIHFVSFRYFAFISKHPLLPRFACHVFMSNQSTQPIVESIGSVNLRILKKYRP